eukprot:m.206822 g.206822  ORF g.206822 m.206822 type:complete len:596 (-) comp32970_c0_seq1:111-1898(-)
MSSTMHTENGRSNRSGSFNRGVWHVTVTGSEKVKPANGGDTFTGYRFNIVTPAGAIHERVKRYSSLRDLHKTLTTLHSTAIESIAGFFPRKSLLGGKGVIQERVASLDKYFKAAFSQPELVASISLRLYFEITNGLVWYKTISACAVCTFVDMGGIKWTPASIEENDGLVNLCVHCPKHGDIKTIFCKSARFFHRLARRQLYCSSLATYNKQWLGKSASSVAAAKAVALKTSAMCTVLDMPIVEDGKLVTDNRIDTLCHAAKGTNVVLRVQTKLVNLISAINNKMHQVVSSANDHSIIIEMPHDRLIQLAQTDSSVLMKRRVTPAVTYFLRKGEELLCHRELVATICEVSRFQGLDLHVYLHLERPFPDLTEILEMLRRHNETVRVIKLSLSRPRHEIIRCSKLQASMSSIPFGTTTTEPNQMPTVDFFELVEHIESNTHGELSSDDFVSLSAGTLLEPILPHIGYNKFKFRPCDSAGAMALLLHSKESGSVSANKLMDLETFVDKLQPICGTSTSALAIASAARKAFRESVKKEVQNYPSLSALSGESTKFPDVLLRSQIFFVQRDVDLAALDMEHLLAPTEYSSKVASLLSAL